MTKFADACLVLERYISPMNARAVLMRALRAEGLGPETLTSAGLRRCSGALRRGVSLFVSPAQLDEAMSAINAICGSDSMPIDHCYLELHSEHHIGEARARARRICTNLQADAFCVQKVATIVSELARNTVSYAGTGSLEIVPYHTRPKRIVVCVTDNGPGITNLEAILAGRYRSKTGTGRGLLGVQRLADSFEIRTDDTGTRIMAEVML